MGKSGESSLAKGLDQSLRAHILQQQKGRTAAGCFGLGLERLHSLEQNQLAITFTVRLPERIVIHNYTSILRIIPRNNWTIEDLKDPK